MNTTAIKNYAPGARRDFIQAVTDRAAYFGLTKDGAEEILVQGDVALIGGRAFPAAVADQRKKLEERIKAEGFDHVMEVIAYTWFNRLVAIRYMELHGYLSHGYRVLSHPEDKTHPEILDHAADVDLPALDREQAVELKLDGGKDEELYRLLLVAQCNALHQAMPFLFERLGDETELLLPGNLLHTGSLIRQLVTDILEGDWQEIEIIGWLYQFYISEKKDQVIGKVVKSEDIPAATQLFTPNWIVKYMVQNSLGAQWLATYPDSPLKGQMEYYIEPAEQTEEVNAQLKAITPESLNPEELTLIDPACGSGHILVEAYDLFRTIYLERGYRQRDVAQLILEKNLFGLDIDERAAQLTGFALMMKGRADDRRLFERGLKLNVMALVESAEFDAEGLAKGVELGDYGLKPGDLTDLKQLFEHAKTFGSLIHVPQRLEAKLPALKQLREASSQDLFVSEALNPLGRLVQQAELLVAEYDSVVANPPYMGIKYYSPTLKSFVAKHYKAAKADLYSCFIQRNADSSKTNGFVGMITIPNWMFLSSFEAVRDSLLGNQTIDTLIHNGRGAFGSDFGSVVFILRNTHLPKYRGVYRRLFETQGSVSSNRELSTRFFSADNFTPTGVDFKKIPGSPIVYWVSERVRDIFTLPSLGSLTDPQVGLQTSDNVRFVRQWNEVSFAKTNVSADSSEAAMASGARWFPMHKGGPFRKWYGNRDLIVLWESNGREIKEYVAERYPYLKGNTDYVVKDRGYFFKEGVTWSHSTASYFSARFMPQGSISNVEGPTVFDDGSVSLFCGLLNSAACTFLLELINPSFHFLVGIMRQLPVPHDAFLELGAKAGGLSRRCIEIAKCDVDSYEHSWDFQSLPVLRASAAPISTLESSYTTWITRNRDTIAEMKRLEEENNRLFIDAYGLADELNPEVPIEQITLTVNPAYRYGGKLTEEELWTRFRQDTMEELVSYAIGCMMGRYSLDAPGLIYAHSGNEGFDPSRYTKFPADDDGIVPLTDTEWFDDDACHRLIDFISIAWDKSHLEANLTFLADNLGPQKNESSRETIRRYLYDKFFSDHLQTYKKRPIYWLFSSGKKKAFQCLVYLHRYHAGTLARMRTEYVIPLQGKLQTRADRLREDIDSATSSSHQKKLTKERDKLLKQQEELRAFDEQLRHYADQRIELDLDDGVKVNYAKFGPLLAESKSITGKK